jgi:hypothetical protein
MMSASGIKEMVISEDVPNSTCVPGSPFSSGKYPGFRAMKKESAGGATAEEKKTDPATCLDGGVGSLSCSGILNSKCP